MQIVTHEMGLGRRVLPEARAANDFSIQITSASSELKRINTECSQSTSLGTERGGGGGKNPEREDISFHNPSTPAG